MRFIIETISGRKGVKSFDSMNDYIDFMTKNAEKIKTIVESEMPYDDKPVKLPKVSSSKGWDTVDSSTFGDINSDGEKGDCLLPQGNQGVFKNNAKFEPSKSSKNSSENGSSKDFKEFEYEDSDKSESKPSEKSSEKDEDKEQVNEGIKDNLKKAGKYAKGAIAGAAMAGALAGNANAMQDPYYDGAQRPFDNGSYEQVVNINGQEYTRAELKKLQQEYNLSDEEMQQIMNGEDLMHDGAQNPMGESVGSEIEETLRLAGVQLNEMEDTILEVDDDDDEEDYGTCEWCGDELPMDELKKEKDLGLLCNRCIRGIESREGPLTFEDDYVEEQAHNEQDGEMDEKTGKAKLFEEEPKKKSYEQMTPAEKLSYAKKQVRMAEEEAMLAQYDDFGSLNGTIDRANRNLARWKAEVKKNQELVDGESIEENCETLEEEITPSRLWKYQEHPEMDFAILSADRSERTPEENEKLSNQLKKDIKDLGYWYTELKGGYVEIGENGKRIPVDGENSYIVPKMKKEEAMDLGKKYDQDTVMFKDAKNGTLEYIITNTRAGNVGDTDSSFETQAGRDNFSVTRGNDLDYYSKLPKSNKPDLKIGFNWKG